MKCWKTMPMPALIASAGECRVTCGAVDLDGAVVGLLHAVQDLHQRRLAGTVLADDGVDGAAADVDVDVVVGDHAREPLADAAQPDGDCSAAAAAAAPRRSVRDTGWSSARTPASTASGRTLPNVARTSDGRARGARSGRVRGPGAVGRFDLAVDHGVVGTVISPSMICCLYASSWSLMSSIKPPLVA